MRGEFPVIGMAFVFALGGCVDSQRDEGSSDSDQASGVTDTERIAKVRRVSEALVFTAAWEPKTEGERRVIPTILDPLAPSMESVTQTFREKTNSGENIRQLEDWGVNVTFSEGAGDYYGKTAWVCHRIWAQVDADGNAHAWFRVRVVKVSMADGQVAETVAWSEFFVPRFVFTRSLIPCASGECEWDESSAYLDWPSNTVENTCDRCTRIVEQLVAGECALMLATEYRAPAVLLGSGLGALTCLMVIAACEVLVTRYIPELDPQLLCNQAGVLFENNPWCE
jgi:hypothetical protein